MEDVLHVIDEAYQYVLARTTDVVPKMADEETISNRAGR